MACLVPTAPGGRGREAGSEWRVPLCHLTRASGRPWPVQVRTKKSGGLGAPVVQGQGRSRLGWRPPGKGL